MKLIKEKITEWKERHLETAVRNLMNIDGITSKIHTEIINSLNEKNKPITFTTSLLFLKKESNNNNEDDHKLLNTKKNAELLALDMLIVDLLVNYLDNVYKFSLKKYAPYSFLTYIEVYKSSTVENLNAGHYILHRNEYGILVNEQTRILIEKSIKKGKFLDKVEFIINIITPSKGSSRFVVRSISDFKTTLDGIDLLIIRSKFLH